MLRCGWGCSLRPKGRAGQLPSLSVQLEAQSPGKVKEDKDEGDGEEAEEEEEEDSGSDWDDWSDEEDVSAVRVSLTLRARSLSLSVLSERPAAGGDGGRQLPRRAQTHQVRPL